MTHGAVRIYVWSLQCYCNAVEKYEDQYHMIKHFVGNDLLAHHSEPGGMEERKMSFRGLGWQLPPEGHVLESHQQLCHQHQPPW